MYTKNFFDTHRIKYSKPEGGQTSAKLWSTYIAEAQCYNSALVESWKADMEGMLIFSGLFSASPTAFLIESYRTLYPDSGDITVQVLVQISQQLTTLGNNASWTAPHTADFMPTPSSPLCNTLWFISLCLSLTCALFAILVEQWAREFLHKAEKRPREFLRHNT
ncbi:hypothetical protein FB451DRAFT_1048816 [Mycena latifolia]|nr:hypothetical protein FB451DRAFT_1048816 [Mycena latifolia]